MADYTERIAFGMFVLESPIWWEHGAEWARLPQIRRDLYLSRARFVLSYAPETSALGMTDDEARELQAELDELERTDPDVAAAARSYDRMIERVTGRRLPPRQP